MCRLDDQLPLADTSLETASSAVVEEALGISEDLLLADDDPIVCLLDDQLPLADTSLETASSAVVEETLGPEDLLVILRLSGLPLLEFTLSKLLFDSAQGLKEQGPWSFMPTGVGLCFPDESIDVTE